MYARICHLHTGSDCQDVKADVSLAASCVLVFVSKRLANTELKGLSNSSNRNSSIMSDTVSSTLETSALRSLFTGEAARTMRGKVTKDTQLIMAELI